MYRSSPFRSTLNTSYITGLDMCEEACTEAECDHHPTPPHPHPRSCVASIMLASSRNVNLCSSLIYTPASVRHRPRRNRCVFSCKMRLTFILTVNLFVTPAKPGGIVVFFSCKVRLGFILTVNLFVTPANPRRNRCVFQWKMRAVPTPQIPCVFSGKMRLAFLVTVKFIWPATNRSRIPYLFSTKTCVAETLPDSVRFLK